MQRERLRAWNQALINGEKTILLGKSKTFPWIIYFQVEFLSVDSRGDFAIFGGDYSSLRISLEFCML